MKLTEFALLTDENIHSDVVDFLRLQGFDVLTAQSMLRPGTGDSEVLRLAFEQRRIAITHDRDFGALAVASKQPFVGIFFLRPGYIEPSFTIDSIRTFLARDIDLAPPFIVVVQQVGDDVHVRVRQTNVI